MIHNIIFQLEYCLQKNMCHERFQVCDITISYTMFLCRLCRFSNKLTCIPNCVTDNHVSQTFHLNNRLFVSKTSRLRINKTVVQFIRIIWFLKPQLNVNYKVLFTNLFTAHNYHLVTIFLYFI